MHNIKRKIIKNIYILSLCLFVICASCSKKETNNVTKDEQAYDMFYSSAVDSISTSPISIKQKALIGYANSHDSLIVHKYLSVAMTCCFYAMNSDSVMILANNILNFTDHNKTKSSDDLYLECDSYNAMGNICSRNGSLEKAIIYYQKAFDILLQLKDNRKIIDIIINIADTNNRLGKLDVGALWYRKALLYNDSLKMPEINKIPVYYGLAQIYTSFRDFKRCNYYYNLVAKHYNDMTSFEKHIYYRIYYYLYLSIYS